MEIINLESVKSFVDTLWVINCAILVFIMQAGFMCMETGLSRYKNSINVDMVVQNISARGKETDLTFTIKLEDLVKTRKLIENNKMIKFKDLIVNKNVSKVSIVGVGMVTTPGITFRMFKALAEKKINIEVISTSEIKISVLINKKNLKKSVEILHQEFKLSNSL